MSVYKHGHFCDCGIFTLCYEFECWRYMYPADELCDGVRVCRTRMTCGDCPRREGE